MNLEFGQETNKCSMLLPCPGQVRLCNTSVLIAGAGGLGCPVAQYLAAAGVGMKLLCYQEDVNKSNFKI